jgi:hypothetical protein
LVVTPPSIASIKRIKDLDKRGHAAHDLAAAADSACVALGAERDALIYRILDDHYAGQTLPASRLWKEAGMKGGMWYRIQNRRPETNYALPGTARPARRGTVRELPPISYYDELGTEADRWARVRELHKQAVAQRKLQIAAVRVRIAVWEEWFPTEPYNVKIADAFGVDAQTVYKARAAWRKAGGKEQSPLRELPKPRRGSSAKDRTSVTS